MSAWRWICDCGNRSELQCSYALEKGIPWDFIIFYSAESLELRISANSWRLNEI